MSLRAMALLMLVLLWLPVHPVAAQLPKVDGVVAEALPSSLRINGLAVEVLQLRGPGLPALIEVTGRQWAAAAQAQGPWQQVSHLSAQTSEVLQWRPTADGFEALYSRLALNQAPRLDSTFGLQLPALCNPTGQLDIGSTEVPVVQLTAQCGGRRAPLQALLSAAATRSGWQPSVIGQSQRLWSRAGQTLQLDLIETPTGVALVALQMGRRVRP